MTADQFSALSGLLRLKPGPTNDAVRLHLVDGLSVPEAARLAGAEYRGTTYAVKRALAGLELARRAAGNDRLQAA